MLRILIFSALDLLRFFFVLLVFALFNLSGPATYAQPDQQRARAAGNQNIILGDTSSFKALKTENIRLRKLLNDHPADTSYWLQLGSNLFDLTEYAAAITALDAALALDSTRYEAWYQRACAHEHLEHATEAYADFDRAISLNPTFEYAWLDRGILLEKMQLYSRAAEDLRYALKLKPNWAPALFSLGTVLEGQHLADSALYYYHAAIAADSAMYKAWNNIGSMQNQQEQYTEAIKSFDRALAIWPGYTFALTNRAQAKYGLNDKDGACSDLKEAIRLGRVDKQEVYDAFCR